MPQSDRKLTLELGTTSIVLDKFLSFTPRIEITDQRPGARHTVNQNSLLTAPVGEGKQIITFSTIGDRDVFQKLATIYQKQNAGIRAGTFTGIIVTDEILQYVEIANAPTRQKTAAPHEVFGDGGIGYYAKFLMAITGFDPAFRGVKSAVAVTLTELAKLAAP